MKSLRNFCSVFFLVAVFFAMPLKAEDFSMSPSEQIKHFHEYSIKNIDDMMAFNVDANFYSLGIIIEEMQSYLALLQEDESWKVYAEQAFIRRLARDVKWFQELQRIYDQCDVLGMADKFSDWVEKEAGKKLAYRKEKIDNVIVKEAKELDRQLLELQQQFMRLSQTGTVPSESEMRALNNAINSVSLRLVNGAKHLKRFNDSGGPSILSDLKKHAESYLTIKKKFNKDFLPAFQAHYNELNKMLSIDENYLNELENRRGGDYPLVIFLDQLTDVKAKLYYRLSQFLKLYKEVDANLSPDHQIIAQLGKTPQERNRDVDSVEVFRKKIEETTGIVEKIQEDMHKIGVIPKRKML